MLLRKAVIEYPEIYGRVAILGCNFADAYSDIRFKEFSEVGADAYEDFGAKIYDILTGDQPAFFRKNLYEVGVIYSPYHILGNHWVALEINLLHWCIYVCDCQPGLLTDAKLLDLLKPLSCMLPHVLRLHGKHSRLGDNLTKQFKVARKTNCPINIDGYVFIFYQFIYKFIMFQI